VTATGAGDPAADRFARVAQAVDSAAGVARADDPGARDARSADLAGYACRLGDDALIAAQRLCEWSARAPDLEEDLALSNIALDQLGAARWLLSYAGAHDGRTEDELAYLRDEADFHNCLLVELENGDFAVTVAKLLFLSTWQHLVYEFLATSDSDLSDIAARTVKEVRYHADHATQWTLRLGDGTEESRRRMQAAVDEVWPYVQELFVDDELSLRLAEAGLAPRPSALWPRFSAGVAAVLEQATLRRPDSSWAPRGGRSGRHTEAFGYLLAQMQVLHRAHPGATW
jgi:ring-1,2-phenylacetyl-CoA epoxidase subunit PaaC